MLFGAEACDIKNKIVCWVRVLWKVSVEHCGSREESIPTGNHSPGHHGQQDPRASGFMVFLCKNHLGTNNNFFYYHPLFLLNKG